MPEGPHSLHDFFNSMAKIEKNSWQTVFLDGVKTEESRFLADC